MPTTPAPRAPSGPTQCGLPTDKPTLKDMATDARARPGSLCIAPRGDLELIYARTFAAPASALFEAWTTPDLLRRWLLPNGWTLDMCTQDLRPGGAYRFEAHDTEGAVMGWGGTYLAVERPTGFEATERFDTQWYPGEARVSVAFHEGAGGTVATLLLSYESLKARDIALRSPMDLGLSEAFARLEGMVTRA